MEALSQPITAEPSQYRQEFVQRLDIMRTNESFCDVTITVKGKEFKAHKAVLAAASPFFLTLLTSDMREINEQVIRIELEETTASVMEDVLKYIYTGNVAITEERAHNLMETADYLLLPSHKTITTIQSGVFNYYFAEKYQCIQLNEKSREVINSYFSVVMETEDFLNIDVKQVMEWVSSDDVTVNAEEEVFRGIVKWVPHKKSAREGHFPELLRQIRLTSVSHDFVLNELMREELFTKDTEFGLNFVVDAMKLMTIADNEELNQQPRRCLEKHKDGIFVCGGRKTLCYFPEEDMWYRLADTPFHYQSHTLTQYKGKIYLFDDEVHKLGESQVIEFYTPAANSWGAIQRPPVDRFTSCTVLNGDLYATYFSFFERRIYRYEEEKNWQDEIDAPPTQQKDTCVVASEKFLYVIGGRLSTGSVSSAAIRFNPTNNSWEEVAIINDGRSSAFGAAMKGKVFIAGGLQTDWSGISTCEVYSPSTNEWQLMPNLKVPRFTASMVCFKEKLYVVGGFTINVHNRCIRALTVEGFDSERNEWKEKSAIPVKSIETPEEAIKDNKFRACFARLSKGVIDELEPLN